MHIAYGTDEVAPTTDAVKAHLADLGHEVTVIAEGDPWPDVGAAVGRAVVDPDSPVEMGIVWCWTGTGVSIAANKIPGVRAALCPDAETARGARRWNDANVLALGLRLTSTPLATEIVEAFLSAEVDDEETAVVATLPE